MDVCFTSKHASPCCLHKMGEKIHFYVNFPRLFSFKCEFGTSEETLVARPHCRVHFPPVVVFVLARIRVYCMYVCVCTFHQINSTLAPNCLFSHIDNLSPISFKHCNKPKQWKKKEIAAYKHFISAGGANLAALKVAKMPLLLQICMWNVMSEQPHCARSPE